MVLNVVELCSIGYRQVVLDWSSYDSLCLVPGNYESKGIWRIALISVSQHWERRQRKSYFATIALGSSHKSMSNSWSLCEDVMKWDEERFDSSGGATSWDCTGILLVLNWCLAWGTLVTGGTGDFGYSSSNPSIAQSSATGDDDWSLLFVTEMFNLGKIPVSSPSEPMGVIMLE